VIRKMLYRVSVVLLVIYLLLSNDYTARRLRQLPELILNYF